MALKINKKSPFWVRAKELMGRAVRKRPGINLSRLDKVTKTGQTVLVASKILGTGTLSHPLNVAAMGFSASARKTIEAKGGKIMTIEEMAAKHPTGKDVGLVI
ncbi:MAG: 50S ribosomal protein L18e [Candidatus Micrarchaeota archaeon]|nr:50S ribosomal protein L18e [Candidatus Micrarchaeota archaeon]